MKKLSENILSWCGKPEQGAIEQAFNLSKHPCLVGNVCLMPDTHEGFGMPIGGVVALKNAISPNMVGVDIGCGMLAVETNLTDIGTSELKEIMSLIRERVPLGFRHHKEPQKHPIFDDPRWNETVVCKKEKQSATHQLGTLGGGNHFIEIQKGHNGHIWFMIHSGSRNLGKKVADYYNKIAEEQCKLWKQDYVVEKQIAFLPYGSEYFESYLKEMNLCLDFSRANRDLMAARIKESFENILGSVEFSEPINIHHNYAALENHYGQNVWVHRKGATLARKGTIGIIPGSQGTKSYIVEGKGNDASLCSCSHGAGRKMSRTFARNNLNLEEEKHLLDERGIIHSIRSNEDLDEAPSAYKDIDIVMKEQCDLVDIIVELQPLAVIKG